MALNKVTYVDGQTVITAENLNDIQDAIIALENAPAQGLTEDMKQALLQLARKVAYIDDQGQTYYDDLYDALYPPKTVVLITAVFEQGSTVIYDDTALDDLKQYLTVTAKFSDNTTSILADNAYTLSGLLEAPSSTVTVLYNGVSTTFTVAVTARPTLSSITAAYTQSGTVYDTDTLDSLKADLVVTAIYSDSSTQTVPATDYTLSGTLTAGTSTITVSYGGKTTTFNVTVTEYLATGWYYPFNGSLLSKGTEEFGFVGNEVYTDGLFGRQAYSHIVPTLGDTTSDTQLGLKAVNLTKYPNIGGDFTVACWFKAQATDKAHPIWSVRKGGSGDSPNKYYGNLTNVKTGWSVAISNNSKTNPGFCFQVSNREFWFRTSNADLSRGAIIVATPPTSFDYTVWHHYAVTRKGTAVKLFIDGSLICQVVALDNTAWAADQIAISAMFNSTTTSDINQTGYGELVQDLYIAEFCKWESDFDPNSITY